MNFLYRVWGMRHTLLVCYKGLFSLFKDEYKWMILFLIIATQRLELALGVNFTTTIPLHLFPILALPLFLVTLGD
jgi:hypothetical protein